MKRILLILVLIMTAGFAFSQADTSLMQGEVSYKSSRNIYVRFVNTEGIQEGDTLFIKSEGEIIPALLVKNLSSISCVCEPLKDVELNVKDKVIAGKKAKAEKNIAVAEEPVIQRVEEGESPVESQAEINMDEERPRQEIYGRISVSSYSNFTNQEDVNNQRLRYRLSLNAEHISDSKLGFESYISFSHNNDDWAEIQDNIFNGLKIYNLALNYEFNPGMQLWLGRKINPRISSLGAIDGLQFEKTFNTLTAGVIAGSRPDYSDYGFNFDLFQAGAYLSHEQRLDKGFIQSSFAFLEQTNKGNTDRRFIYFQHSNRLVKNLYFFGSGEVDLYRKIDEQKENTFNLSNIYLSLRYRMFRQLNLSVSYNARDNLIYYESYDKSFIDRLLETESMQGFRVAANYRLYKTISIGAKAGYRYRADDARPSRNLYTYIYFGRLPLFDLAATVNATFLESSYIKGTVYGAKLSKDLMKGRLYTGIGYRNVDYGYYDYEVSMQQHIIMADINWRVLEKLFFSVNYEATLQDEVDFHRVYLNLTQRF